MLLRCGMVFVVVVSVLPVNFAVADTLFVADGMWPCQVYEFTSGGSQATFATVDSDPATMAFDSAGNLFLGGYEDSSIYKFTPSGLSSDFAHWALKTGLAFDGSGNLFVAGHIGNFPSIGIFAPTGTVSYFLGRVPFPAALAFDRSGNLFVGCWANGSIYEFAPDGSQSTFATGLIGPRALAFDNNGNLFVADDANGIYEFTPSGTSSVFATGLNGPRALAFDSSGNLFEADYHSKTINEFTPDGSRSVFATGLSGPTALAFSPVPEPSTISLLLAGAAGLLGDAWRKSRALNPRPRYS